MGFMDLFKNLFGGKSEEAPTEAPAQDAPAEAAPTEAPTNEGGSEEKTQ